MCSRTSNPDQPKSGNGRRPKLWDLPPAFHCSVVGTCFSLGELDALALKAGFEPSPRMTDYAKHVFFVQAAKGEGAHRRLGKAMHRLLEKKYAAAVARFRPARTEEELDGLWTRALDSGDISGPYWALLTHAHAPETTIERAFGDVHMLSHLAGASNRTDIRQLDQLAREKSALERDLDKERSKRRQRIGQLGERIAALKRALDAERAQRRRCEAELQALQSFSGGPGPEAGEGVVGGLMTRIAEQARDLEGVRRRLTELEGEAGDLRHRNGSLLDAFDQARMEMGEVTRECEALEAQLKALVGTGACSGDCGSAGESRCPLDLDGRCILFVGGRSRQASHFQALVERLNGTFLHHDGGLEQSIPRLHAAVAKADAVLFPADCVSHEATQRIKQACRQQAKPYTVLRRSGLSSFARGLNDMLGLSATPVGSVPDAAH